MLSREWVSFNAEMIENWTQEQFEKHYKDTFEMVELTPNGDVETIWTSKYIFILIYDETWDENYFYQYYHNWRDHPDLPAEWR